MYLRAFGGEGGSGTAPGSPARDMWQVDEVEHDYQVLLMYCQGVFDILERELAQGAAPATMSAGGAPSNELCSRGESSSVVPARMVFEPREVP